MAEVAGNPKWTAAETRAQFAAITVLRWRILRNGLRRKGGIGDVLAIIVMIPFFAFVILSLSGGSGALAGYFVHQGQFEYIAFILWAIFVLCQLASIQLGQPGTTFDPTQLIRFPLGFPGYAAIRVFFGMISPANATSTLMSLAVAIGVSVVEPRLTLYAFTAMAAFALVNIFFTRMLFAWIDRWLSTRRAREAFTGLIVAVSLGIQYLNFTFNPAFHSGRQGHALTAARLAAATNYYHRAEPFLSLLPPGLATNSIAAAHNGQLGAWALEVLGVLLFTAVFFAIFAARLYKEFRGENLSDQAIGVAKTPAKKRVAVAAGSSAMPVAAPAIRLSAPPTVAAVFQKEIISMRRNTGIIYALVGPLVMVILFVNLRMGRTPAYVLFPAAVAYTMMGIAPLCYNSLGLEAAGIQFFFLAPVRMRDVFLAKNLVNLGLAAIEIVAVFAAITYVTHAPSATMTISVLLWAAFTMFLSMAIGNRRSVTAPKKIDPGKMQNKQASPLSALISVGVLLLSAGLGAGVILLGMYFGKPWILPLAMLVLAVVGYAIYEKSLETMDKLLADNRDTLSEVLCKA
jgi:ABC-2 type transport system permease protein